MLLRNRQRMGRKRKRNAFGWSLGTGKVISGMGWRSLVAIKICSAEIRQLNREIPKGVICTETILRI
jgi:hypothetical protein